MFTWICPQCGHEVPPSYDECPDCAEKARAASQGPSQQPPATQPQPAAPVASRPQPSPAAAVAEPAYRQPAAHPQAAKPAMPAWLVTLLVAAGLIGIGAFVFWYTNRSHNQPVIAAGQSSMETPGRAESVPVKAHPLAKLIEITGLRVTEDEKQKAQVRLNVVNHSGAELPEMSVSVNLKAVASRADQEPVANFAFKVPPLRAYESRELTTPVKTKLRAYELPDWQFLRAEFQITSPAP